MEAEKEEDSQVVPIYSKFMEGITTEKAMAELTSDNLRRHRIIRVPKRPIASLRVYLINISNNGMIAEYRVRIGEFRIYVKVLNLHIKTTAEGGSIGKGTFGIIMEKHVATQKFVAKVQSREVDK
jgi:hypothetical protein